VTKPTPPPTDYCTSALDPSKLPPVLRDEEWTDLGVDQAAQLRTAVDRAIKLAQTKCPAAWANDQCLVRGVAGIDVHRDISRELQGAGMWPASSKQPEGRPSDGRTRADNVYEEWKLFAYTNGCLTGNPYKGAVRPMVEEPPVVVRACPAPVPPRLWTEATLPPGWGSDEIGQPRFEVKAKDHSRVVDSTPIVAPRACEYCESIGMGEMSPGVPRCGCPVRPDGHPDRVACEDVLLVPPAGVHGPKWVKDGSTVALASCSVAPDSDPCVTDNPFQAESRGQAIRACAWDMAESRRRPDDGARQP
jgi:hypothetical protein